MPTLYAVPDPVHDRPRQLRVVDESEPTPPRPTSLLRAAALRADRSEGVPGYAEADAAIRLWEGLLSGRWTLVDWFDAGGRRFVIAKRCETHSQPRKGLTKRERQVAIYAARGESSKCIGYSLGISPSRVSALLKAAMLKLGVRSKAQLVVMARALSTRGQWSRPSSTALELNA